MISFFTDHLRSYTSLYFDWSDKRSHKAKQSRGQNMIKDARVWYSWGHLVVPYTEELISRPFLDENSIWRLFWDRVDPWPAAGCFFPALCHFCIGFHWIAKSHGAGTVFSGGFVSKTLRWISFQLYLLHFPKPILTSLIAAWICFQQWQCSCFYANMTGLPLSSLLYFHHH